MKKTLTIEWREREVELPAKRIVCPRCDGEGSHVNPNVDGNGITQEEFDADPEFLENYMDGVYDVTCHECDGQKVVSVVDEDRLTRRQKLIYDDHMRLLRLYHAEVASEREYGY